MATYDKGDLVILTASWQNEAGAYVDPTTITLKIQDPTGSTTSYAYGSSTMTKTATGRYRYEYQPTAQGKYSYRWEGTGTATATGQSGFFCEDRLV